MHVLTAHTANSKYWFPEVIFYENAFHTHFQNVFYNTGRFYFHKFKGISTEIMLENTFEVFLFYCIAIFCYFTLWFHVSELNIVLPYYNSLHLFDNYGYFSES